jgi:CRP/FNR family transcriptional regulator, cyclic AMP receptor protein
MSAVNGNPGRGPRTVRVRLRDVDPDFLRYVADDERGQAAAAMLPALDLKEGPFDSEALLSQSGGFCGLLLSGMVNRQIKAGGQVALRVLGPGAVIPILDSPSSELIGSSQWAAVGTGRLAVIGQQFMRAAARWPKLYTNLIGRFADQNEQLATQLALCQLPRVEDRLLGILWLLAESWGKVTSAGTLLPVHFTHEALGAMVGARRPTVTLALGELADSGAIVQRDGGWLLLQPPRQSRGKTRAVESPRLLDLEPTVWAEQNPLEVTRDERLELIAHVSQLREQHRRSIGELHELVRRAEAIRTRSLEVRQRLRAERELTGRRLPHSS